jgi:alpha-tubulin suppressor-like RCC1 family protein
MKARRNLIQICLVCAIILQALTTGAQPVTQIAAGELHSLFLKSDGSLWAMGGNHSFSTFFTTGQLGDGTWNNTNRPELIVASGVTAIAAGGFHSLFLKSDGSLWAMGLNSDGQLGDGTSYGGYIATNRPEQIVAGNVTSIAAGYSHSLFLKTGGSLWGMGDNSGGELGDGTYNRTNQPEQIVASNVTAMATGYTYNISQSSPTDYSLFLKSDGSLWAMGNNLRGQLGDGTYSSIYDGINKPEQIVAGGVTAIAAGGLHSLFLKSNGSLWAMGDNQYGQLGDGTTNNVNRPEQIVASNVTAIAAGDIHSLFLKKDGSLWGMGYNGDNELGDGTYNQTNRPEMIVASNVVAIAAGGYHSMFIKSDGSLWVMGDNWYGDLGDGTYNTYNPSVNRPEQIVPSNFISIQQLNDGSVYLSFQGLAGTNYVLESTFNLLSANWVSQVTNPADSKGMLVFTNTPDATTNNFWRIRSVP